MRLYGIAAYLKEVAGDRAAADALIAELDRSQASRGSIGVSGARLWIVQILVRRRLFSEARERLAEADPLRDVQNRDLTYEAWAELIAAEGAWDEAPSIVAAAREWAERTGLMVLPAFADRLEGGAALAVGDVELGLDRLRRARATFARHEAGWERARTEIALAEALIAAGRTDEAAEAAGAALATLTGLGSAHRDRARARAGRPLQLGDRLARGHLVDQPAQLPAQDAIRQVLAGDLEVVPRVLPDPPRIREKGADLLDRVLGDRAVDLDQPQAERTRCRRRTPDIGSRATGTP